MTVVLEPPITSGMPYAYSDIEGENRPLLTAPRYLRGSGMGRWHRPRSGFTIARDNHRIVYRLWCGQSLNDAAQCITADQPPRGEPVCGTCEGRSVGAGQDEWPDPDKTLLFEPRWRLTRPAVCPGSQRQDLCEDVAQRVVRCLPCGELVPCRAYGGSKWSGPDGYGAAKHEPGLNLVPGCPFHAWRYLAKAADGTVACGCKVNRRPE